MIKLLFLLIAAALYGMMYFVAFYTKDEDSFWSKGGWKRKYDMNTPAPDNWYYKFFNLKYKEKFWLSGTVLVFLTDIFHLTQFFVIKFILLAVSVDSAFHINWWMFFGGWLIWVAGFNTAFLLMGKK